MQLAIGLPKSGWLPISISIEGQCFNFKASNVVNDPLSEFLAAAVWCLDADHQMPPVAQGCNSPCFSHKTRGVHFWMEPEWHTLLIHKQDVLNAIRLTFYVHHEGGLDVDDDDFRTSTKTYFESLTPIVFAHTVWLAISDAFNSDGIQRFKSDWGRPFSHDLLSDLAALVGES